MTRINRRKAVQWSVASAALTATCRISAADELEPIQFVIVSDTHLGRKDNQSAEKNWRKAVGEINSQTGDFVLHLGDVVDSGRPQQYPVYEETRGLLKKPIHEIPGNHVPIHKNRPPDRAWYVKPDHGQTDFYEIQKRHSDRILACFHGHFHNGIRGWRDNGQTVESLMPSVCYNQKRNLKVHIANGKADGFSVDELRPGYVLGTLGKGKMTLQYKPLGAESEGQYVADWS